MQAFVDPYLVACRLAYRPVRDGFNWHGKGLRIVATNGIPYGHDRLLFIWAATMAHWFGCCFSFAPSHIPEMFGLGWSRDEVFGCLDRVLGAQIETTQLASSGQRLRWSPINWLEITPHECRIRLDSQFDREHLIPISVEVVSGCVRRGSIAALDLYLWQIVAGGEQTLPARIPVFGDGGLLDELGSTIRDPRKARQELRARQALVAELWPEYPHRLSDDRNYIILNPMETQK